MLGHWPASLAAELLTFVEGEDRSMCGWAREIGALPIESPVALGKRQHARRPAGAMTSSRVRPALILRPNTTETGTRACSVEMPVAIEVDGLGYAVMMMTPAELEPFRGRLHAHRTTSGRGGGCDRRRYVRGRGRLDRPHYPRATLPRPDPGPHSPPHQRYQLRAMRHCRSGAATPSSAGTSGKAEG